MVSDSQARREHGTYYQRVALVVGQVGRQTGEDGLLQELRVALPRGIVHACGKSDGFRRQKWVTHTQDVVGWGIQDMQRVVWWKGPVLRLTQGSRNGVVGC